METQGWRRWLMGMWAALEVLLFGGLVYGWPSLVFLLKQRHIYRDLCHHHVTTLLLHNDTLPAGGNISTPADLSVGTNQSDDFFGRTDGIENEWNTSSLLSGYRIKLDHSENLFNFTFLSHKHAVKNSGGFVGEMESNSTGLAKENCAKQDAAFALGYTIVSAIQAGGSVVTGHAQRHLGLRTTRIGCGAIYICGLLMVGLISPDRPVLLITGMVCVATAGLALLITNIQLGILFGRGQTTFVGVLSGCFDVSAIMQLLIKTVISAGADFMLTYIGVAVLSCMTLVSSLLWLPRGSVFSVTKQSLQTDIVTATEAEPITSPKEESHKSTSYMTTRKLLPCLTSPLYILHLVWFSFLQLRLFFFVGVLNRWLTSLSNGNLQDVDHFTSVQLYTGCTSLVFAVIAGSLYDLQRHRYKGAAVLPLLLGSALCCTLSALVLIRQQQVLYVTFIVLAAFRSFMYSLAAAFLTVTFPAELFGVLYGIMIIGAGFIGCLQYPLFLWSETSRQAILQVNILLLCTSVITFCHPIHILWKCRRSKPSLAAPAHPDGQAPVVGDPDPLKEPVTTEDDNLNLLTIPSRQDD